MPTPDPHDTIVALSSADGPGARAIVRLSGPGAFDLTASFVPTRSLDWSHRRRHAVQMELVGIESSLPAELYCWPAPATYTGQDLVEIHTVGSPPLVNHLITQLLNRGCRAAQPGEFTLRAFLASKLDLPRAEAILGVIHAADRTELKQALSQLAGGVTRPLQALRDDLLDLLAEVEAGLDFAEEDIDPVGHRELLDRLTRGLAHLTLLQKQLDQRAAADRPFRVVLAGRPNAGKSSLFNALTGGPHALVSAAPGTTRDYLVRTIKSADAAFDLIDTAGPHESPDAVDSQAQALGRRQIQEADLLLWCASSDAAAAQSVRDLSAFGGTTALGVLTKCDLGPPPLPWPQTSARTGAGINLLRELLMEQVQARRSMGLASSLSRCRHHVEHCLRYLRAAHNTVLFNEPREILAVELRGALDQVGEMVGAVYTDDLLDRIFSRFCIGK